MARARSSPVPGAARPRHSLGGYAAYLFDVDGTLIYPGHAVPGAAEALAALRERGKSVLAVTNNSSMRQHDLADRFRQVGLPIQDAEVFSALVATVRFVAHERPGARVQVFGNPGLRDEAADRGLQVSDSDHVDYLVVGNNQRASYEGLTHAMRALLHGARFVAVNEDRAYVGRDGGLVPGAGAWVAALERITGRRPDVIVGKPSATILVEAAESVGCEPTDCVYVGDNQEVDVAGAHAAAMDAALVLTGVARRVDPGLEQPEHVMESVLGLALAE